MSGITGSIAKEKGVSIIIPTICSADRRAGLLRAIGSCLDQGDISVEVLLIVNGDRFDALLYDELKNNKELSLAYLTAGNVSQARYAGIKQCKYDYFCFLDDDDELLTNTLEGRAAILTKKPELAVVVSNGYISKQGEDRIHVDKVLYKQIVKSLIDSFLVKSWLGPNSSLFNKKNIALELFDIEYRYFELSYLFFKLCEKQYKIEFDNTPVYKYNADTVSSVSKSEKYLLAYPNMLSIFLQMDLKASAKNKLQNKYITALNSLSIYYMKKNDFKNALSFHYQCLKEGGFSYFLYTRKIVYAFIRFKLT